MTEQEDLNLKGMKLGITRAIRFSGKSLEHTAEKLDKEFEGLGARNLPEYQAVLKAVKAYEVALVNLFKKKYIESSVKAPAQ